MTVETGIIGASGVHRWVDLRSDTCTKPTGFVRKAMFDAEVGDEVYRDDPSVSLFESHVAGLLGKEAAMFVPSGTMSNLLAMAVYCGRGQAAIVGDESHIYNFESMNASTHLGVGLRPVTVLKDGTLDVKQIIKAYSDGSDVHKIKTTVLCVENTQAMVGGAIMTPKMMRDMKDVADKLNMKMHLDGARLHVASAASGYSLMELAESADTVSICFSKTVGGPVGSVLAGSAIDIERARFVKKCIGGFGRQVGHLAAAAMTAEFCSKQGLKEDIHHAKLIGAILSHFSQTPITSDFDLIQLDSYLNGPHHQAKLTLSKLVSFSETSKSNKFKNIVQLRSDKIDSNLVLFEFTDNFPNHETAVGRAIAFLNRFGFMVGSGYRSDQIRFVFHYGISSEDAYRLANALVLFLASEIDPQLARSLDTTLTTTEFASDMLRIEGDSTRTKITFTDDTSEPTVFLNAWLRDHCIEASDDITKKRLMSAASIPSSQRITFVAFDKISNRVMFTWDTGIPILDSSKMGAAEHVTNYVSTFTIDYLKQNGYATTTPNAKRQKIVPHNVFFNDHLVKLWNTEESNTFKAMPYHELNNSSVLQDKARLALLQDGIVRVTEIELPSPVSALTNQQTWINDVKLKVSSILNTAATYEPYNQTLSDLELIIPHADCNNNTSLVDGLAVAEDLLKLNLRAFEYFCTTPFKFERYDATNKVTRSSWGTMIELTPSATIQNTGLDKYAKLRYSNDCRDDLVHLLPLQIEQYYTYIKLLDQCIARNTILLRPTAASGKTECLVIHSRRILPVLPTASAC